MWHRPIWHNMNKRCFSEHFGTKAPCYPRTDSIVPRNRGTHWTDPSTEYLIARSQLTKGSVGKVPFNFWWKVLYHHICLKIYHHVQFYFQKSQPKGFFAQFFPPNEHRHENPRRCWADLPAFWFRSEAMHLGFTSFIGWWEFWWMLGWLGFVSI